MGQKCIVFSCMIIAMTISAGLIAGGAVLCKLSVSGSSLCTDWKYNSSYGSKYWTCTYTALSIIAKDKCSTECYCANTAFVYDCLALPQNPVSPSLLGGGIAMLVGGLLVFIATICLGCAGCKKTKSSKLPKQTVQTEELQV